MPEEWHRMWQNLRDCRWELVIKPTPDTDSLNLKKKKQLWFAQDLRRNDQMRIGVNGKGISTCSRLAHTRNTTPPTVNAMVVSTAITPNGQITNAHTCLRLLGLWQNP